MEQVKNDIQDTTLTNELFFLNCLFIIETFVLLQKHPFPSMFTIECGYYVSCSKHSYFHTNIGDDFLALIHARFMNNNLQEYTKKRNEESLCTFVVHEKMYRYHQTPFDIHCRLFHFGPNNNTYEHILEEGDLYFTCMYDIVIYFNRNSGHLGVICELNKHEHVSVFYLIHQCLLIIRDFVHIIENTVNDQNTTFSPI